MNQDLRMAWVASWQMGQAVQWLACRGKDVGNISPAISQACGNLGRSAPSYDNRVCFCCNPTNMPIIFRAYGVSNDRERADVLRSMRANMLPIITRPMPNVAQTLCTIKIVWSSVSSVAVEGLTMMKAAVDPVPIRRSRRYRYASQLE